ncbi:MAG: type II toxin-antitoxin system Phd/YefM family antitoxin [Flexibacteraceae bacterium]|jgi:antitoxin YefM
MQVIDYKNFETNLKLYLDAVSEYSDQIYVAKNDGGEAVVVLSLKEYNSLLETNHLLLTEANRQRLSSALNNVRNGNTLENPLIDEADLGA